MADAIGVWNSPALGQKLIYEIRPDTFDESKNSIRVMDPDSRWIEVPKRECSINDTWARPRSRFSLPTEGTTPTMRDWISVQCRTNLDVMPAEMWPKQLPALPFVDSMIESGCLWTPSNRRLELRVMSVNLKCRRTEVHQLTEWYYEIILGVHKNQSVIDFFNYYGPIVGRDPKSFY